MAKLNIVQLHINQGIETYYAEITENGRRKYRSLHTTNKKEAYKALQRLPQALSSSRGITFSDLYNAFMESNTFKERSIIGYNSFFNVMKPIHNLNIASIDAKDVLNCWDKQIRYSHKKYSIGTLNNFKRKLVSIYNYAVSNDLISKNPFTKINIPSVSMSTPKSFWTVEEVERILANTERPDMKLVFSIMAYEGLRLTEAMSITEKNIDGDYIHLTSNMTKFNKEARLPLHPKLKSILPPKFKCKVSTNTVQYQLNLVLKKLGLKGSPHKFRHSFCSNMLINNANPVAVSKLARHSNTSTTLNIYSHVMDRDMKEALLSL